VQRKVTRSRLLVPVVRHYLVLDVRVTGKMDVVVTEYTAP